MSNERKGMTMALSVIISIVVLIVLALAVIAITGGSLGRFGSGVDDNQVSTQVSIKCQTWFTNWCVTHPGQTPSDYPSYTVTENGNDVTVDCAEVLGDMSCSSGVTSSS